MLFIPNSKKDIETQYCASVFKTFLCIIFLAQICVFYYFLRISYA